MSAQKRMLAHVERAIALVDPYAVPAATTGAPAAASERAPRHLDPAARGALRRSFSPDDTPCGPAGPGKGGQMSFFGGLGKRIKDGRIADGLAAAQAALGGDYATAQRIQEAGRERRAQAQQLKQLRDLIGSDPSLQDQDAGMMTLYPQLYQQFVLQRALDGARKGTNPVAELTTPNEGRDEATGVSSPSVANSARCFVRPVFTEEEWNHLTPGEIYCAPDGRVMRKR